MNEVQVHLDREWNMKRKVLGISAGISFLLFLLLFAISNRMVNSLDTQTIVKRWSEDGGNAHVSCFFSVNSGVSQDRIEELEHSYDSLLADAGILPEYSSEGGLYHGSQGNCPAVGGCLQRRRKDHDFL